MAKYIPSKTSPYGAPDKNRNLLSAKEYSISSAKENSIPHNRHATTKTNGDATAAPAKDTVNENL